MLHEKRYISKRYFQEDEEKLEAAFKEFLETVDLDNPAKYDKAAQRERLETAREKKLVTFVFF